MSKESGFSPTVTSLMALVIVKEISHRTVRVPAADDKDTVGNGMKVRIEGTFVVPKNAVMETANAENSNLVKWVAKASHGKIFFTAYQNAVKKIEETTIIRGVINYYGTSLKDLEDIQIL